MDAPADALTDVLTADVPQLAKSFTGSFSLYRPAQSGRNQLVMCETYGSNHTHWYTIWGPHGPAKCKSTLPDLPWDHQSQATCRSLPSRAAGVMCFRMNAVACAVFVMESASMVLILGDDIVYWSSWHCVEVDCYCCQLKMGQACVLSVFKPFTCELPCWSIWTSGKQQEKPAGRAKKASGSLRAVGHTSKKSARRASRMKWTDVYFCL